MDEDQLIERVHELQRSLKDGDDLAKAISLIGDALQRRMTSIRESLEGLAEDDGIPDGERLAELVDRVRGTLDRYEAEIEERHERMEALVDEFQDSLGSRADELGRIEQDLAGPLAREGEHG